MDMEGWAADRFDISPENTSCEGPGLAADPGPPALMSP